jgi:putative ABC transport system permease protein
MRLTRNLVLSCEILAAHALRTLLAITGVIVGVAAVILAVSAGQGAEERILARIRTMGTNLIIVNAGQTSIVAGRQRQVSIVKTLVPADARAVASDCPSVAVTCPAAIRKLKVHWEGETASTSVAGLAAEGFRIRNLHVAAGRALEAEEGRAARRVAVLGATVVRNLFGDDDPIGQQIRIGRVPFEVVGTLARKGMDPNGADQDDIVIVPLETALRRLFNVTHVQTIYVQATGADALGRAEQEIGAVLHERHRLGEKADDFTVQNQAVLLETERQTSRSLTTLVGGAAAISLAVGGVGILAVMLISVRQRTREIGLRRALGARRRDIRTQFLLESALLAGVGGLAGILLGIAGVSAISALGYWDMVISWPAAGVGFLFSVVVGVIFGLYPATCAARLQPIEALRAE